MKEINNLANDARRQLINTVDLYEDYQAVDNSLRHKFAGSMRWGVRESGEYLLKKVGNVEKSLGKRADETEKVFEAFETGRQKARVDLATLDDRLKKAARMNVAMGLGRVPRESARIIREINKAGLLGKNLFIAGTNAIYAYEAKAGVRIDDGLMATTDLDLLWDARQTATFVGDIKEKSLLAILQKVDKSFDIRRPKDFRASNGKGFFVDLIRPEVANEMSPDAPSVMGAGDNDLFASPIRGLERLINAPKFKSVAIDEDGMPLEIECVDPRAYALHKAWISTQPERDPLKKNRDIDQARNVAILARDYLGLDFDDQVLSALPEHIRSLRDEVLIDEGQEYDDQSFEP